MNKHSYSIAAYHYLEVPAPPAYHKGSVHLASKSKSKHRGPKAWSEVASLAASVMKRTSVAPSAVWKSSALLLLERKDRQPLSAEKNRKEKIRRTGRGHVDFRYRGQCDCLFWALWPSWSTIRKPSPTSSTRACTGWLWQRTVVLWWDVEVAGLHQALMIRGNPELLRRRAQVNVPIIRRCTAMAVDIDDMLFTLDETLLLRRWTDLTTSSPSSINTLRDHFLTSNRPYSSADVYPAGSAWW